MKQKITTPPTFNGYFGLRNHHVSWPALLSILPEGDVRLVALLIGKGYSPTQIESELCANRHVAQLRRLTAEEQIQRDLCRHGLIV